jgi:hypothetical protein
LYRKEDKTMTNKKIWLGMLAAALTFGVILAGCDTGGGGGENPSLDSALVAKWYTYPGEVDDPEAEPLFEITASGEFISEGNMGEINVTTSGGIISSTITLNGEPTEGGTAAYTVIGNKLRLSDPRYAGSPNGGVFMAFVSALQLAQDADAIAGGILGADGYFHKSGTGGKDPEEPGGKDPEEPGGKDPEEPGGKDPEEPGGSSIGCSSLSDGTKCSAQSGCSSKFLCLTGQGSDSNCTTGCACK